MPNIIDLTPKEIGGTPVYNLSQTAARLNLTYSAMLRVLRKNHIQRYEQGFGRDVYVKKEDVEALLVLRPMATNK